MSTAFIPPIGLGTFRLIGQKVIDSVRTGLKLGYRHVDTAQIYENEADVGRALAESTVPRGDLFVTTKVWTENLSRDRLIPSLKESLRKLRMEQVDLALIHWPSTDDALPVAEYMQALAEAKKQGLARLIGISNFPIAYMRQAIAAVGAAEIATNQVELHPFLQNNELVEFACANRIQVTAYMPLAYGKVMQDATLLEIARRHGVSAAQVALAWSLQLGHVVIPSSTKPANLAANLEAAKLELSAADMEAIAGLDRGERLTSPDFSPKWD